MVFPGLRPCICFEQEANQTLGKHLSHHLWCIQGCMQNARRPAGSCKTKHQLHDTTYTWIACPEDIHWSLLPVTQHKRLQHHQPQSQHMSQASSVYHIQHAEFTPKVMPGCVSSSLSATPAAVTAAAASSLGWACRPAAPGPPPSMFLMYLSKEDQARPSRTSTLAASISLMSPEETMVMS